MRRACATGLTIAVVLLAGTSGASDAQQPASGPPPREQVHPELVDTTWGPRTAAAWQLALAHHWEDARTRFSALHAEHPQALEALVGLGFVARATGARADARRWFHDAAAVEPSNADVRKQVEATEWDRPGSIEISGSATRVGTQTTADWSVGTVVPITQQFSLTARAGALGAGDPLRGIFIDSVANGGAQARVVSAGAVIRPIETLTLTTRVDVWSAGGTDQTYFWVDATQRLNDHFAVRVGSRPLGGSDGAPQFTGAADFTIVQNETVSLEVIQATRAAKFEPRTQIRGFYQAMPTLRQSFRVGLLRDTGPTNQATTGFVAATWLFTPTLGVRVEVSKREGAFPRSSAGGGLVIHW